MKNLILTLIVVVALFLTACNNSGNGQLIGAQDRIEYNEVEPFGMKIIPQGHFKMGVGDEDPTYSMTYSAKNVTVQTFWMDETEITNNEYRQFVEWVVDSIIHVQLGETLDEEDNEHYMKYGRNDATEDHDEGEVIEPKHINWETEIDWESTNEEYRTALAYLILDPSIGNERYYHYKMKDMDIKKLVFEYWWYDKRAYKDDEVQGAAFKEFDNVDPQTKDMGMFSNRPTAYNQGAKPFLRHEAINIYPDTLCWIHDFVYSFNEPQTNTYFWHPVYDHYPVVGVSWKQARAFCAWRSHIRNNYLSTQEWAYENEFRLPNEAEWEWAARGYLSENPYPWGGPYTQNINGCFLGNFKPNRGNYSADGGVLTVIVAHYHPNDWGLYDMAGNVAEWCEDAYNESAHNFAHDLNMQYTYFAKDSDPPVLKRKVVRGGSWKDISYYMNTATRTYCYQDTGKSYIGFRCVQSYLGRVYGDNLATASNVY
ncbi:MAG: SUMF1/EgtB/PvdO family nonheme iron enzyme [Bacteroidales bacterium]|nr:SUMF1/EgtB/PvdO family nonheme iron enzyme [Bacteroidales bacterium]